MSSAREQGFTLLETMVALSVFSLAALALVRLEGTTVRSSGAIATQSMAQIVANNLMVEALTDPLAPAVGSSEGSETNGGAQWRWRRIVAKTADPRIVRIDLIVSDTGGRPAARLTFARPVQ